MGDLRIFVNSGEDSFSSKVHDMHSVTKRYNNRIEAERRSSRASKISAT